MLRPHIFIHIPKTGGSSIRRVPGIEVKHHRTARWHQRRKRDFADRFVFAFVRNPYDRFVSTFYYWHTMRAGHEYWRSDCRIARAVQQFADLADFCRRFRRFRYRRVGHFRPQHEWTHYRGECLVDFVGRFERLQEDWAAVAQVLAAPAALPHANPSPHPHWSTQIDDVSGPLVRELYAADFRLFGYEM